MPRAARPKPPPGTLVVLGQPYSITLLPPTGGLAEAYGLCNEETRAITVRDNMTPIDLKDTTLHEVLHAIRRAQGREYGGRVEEDYVRSLATGLTMVLQENPEFAKWLVARPRKKPQ